MTILPSTRAKLQFRLIPLNQWISVYPKMKKRKKKLVCLSTTGIRENAEITGNSVYCFWVTEKSDKGGCFLYFFTIWRHAETGLFLSEFFLRLCKCLHFLCGESKCLFAKMIYFWGWNQEIWWIGYSEISVMIWLFWFLCVLCIILLKHILDQWLFHTCVRKFVFF